MVSYVVLKTDLPSRKTDGETDLKKKKRQNVVLCCLSNIFCFVFQSFLFCFLNKAIKLKTCIKK